MSDIVINDDFGALTELLDNAELAPTVEDLTQCETAVIERIRAEVAARSDGLRRAIVWHEKLAEDAKRVAKQAEARAAKIRAYVKGEMEAAGIKKIQTATGSLTVRGNGGIEPLVIFDEAQVPDAYRNVTVTMPVEVWIAIRACLGEEWDAMKFSPAQSISNSRIREALAKPCEICYGAGLVCANCHGFEDYCGDVALCEVCGGTRRPKAGRDREQCGTCGGSGKAQVPGARLEPRGTSLLVK